VDCYPGGCSWRIFAKNGKVVREEQAGLAAPIEPGIPDMNPMGCQKGACWSHCLYSPDRVTTPLKRVGERGEGKFEPVSWDDALTDIADAMLDAIEEYGAEAILTLLTPEVGAGPARLFSNLLGTPTTDGNAEFQDFSPGWHLTWGLFNPVSSMEDWFLADLTLIWHANPVYTNIHWYHYLAESRYNGGEVVTVAPDFSPSAIHADYHQPIRVGTDAALALSMCKVIIDAGLYQKQFVQEQTDLPLLVRTDNGRFLRASDVSEGDREDQFYWWDLDRDAHAGAARDAGHDRGRARSRGDLHGHPQGRDGRPGRAGLCPAAQAPRELRSGDRREDLRDPPGQHPQARSQGGHPAHQDLHRLELR
jgi:anaerobic selenocysteine-containing dehydrogenase